MKKEIPVSVLSELVSCECSGITGPMQFCKCSCEAMEKYLEHLDLREKHEKENDIIFCECNGEDRPAKFCNKFHNNGDCAELDELRAAAKKKRK